MDWLLVGIGLGIIVVSASLIAGALFWIEDEEDDDERPTD